MKKPSLKTLDVRTPAEWRRWLAAHHDSESEVWLIYYKQHSGQPSISYEDSVDEALCFGWVDSLIRRLDDLRYARKFTPRKAGSKWSTSNRNRYAQLQASGRLAPQGMLRPPTLRSGDAPRPHLEEIPNYIQAGLRSNPAAGRFFEKLAPSYRRLYVAWIDSAKQEETKARRLREAIGRLETGKKLGMK